jgi:peptidoglycan/LPS O-acetylase OafA/YrhL
MSNYPKYIPVITSLRGLAATAVCFYHFVLSIGNYVKDELIRSIFYYGQCGVPIFFVITGVVLPLVMLKKNYK